MSSINRSPTYKNSTKITYNYVPAKVPNHEGLMVDNTDAESKLRRVTMTHMLWQDQFYVDGVNSAAYIETLVKQVHPDKVAALAKEARSEFKLRHVPLLLMRGLAKKGALRAEDLAEVIQRPDELGEFLAIYRKDNKREPLSNQVKRGLATAFAKFNEYSLAKWDKNSAAYSLRDVMFLTHPKPANLAQELLFKKVADQKLETPDTWETELSAGANKLETFSRLMAEKKLGALAFIRNLRNMVSAGVPESRIREYAQTVNLERVLPFRFITAAKQVPQLTDMLEQMMFRCLEGHDKLPGTTVLMVDVSGSMFEMSGYVGKSKDLLRFDAAAALAVLCREICEKVEIFTFSNSTVKLNSKLRGFALVKAMYDSQPHSGTDLRQAVRAVNTNIGRMFDRFIVFTDEQSSTEPGQVNCHKPYVVNVGSYENGIAKKDWLTISGFSEATIDYILAHEQGKV